MIVVVRVGDIWVGRSDFVLFVIIDYGHLYAIIGHFADVLGLMDKKFFPAIFLHIPRSGFFEM
jgi:hypothetical protein